MTERTGDLVLAKLNLLKKGGRSKDGKGTVYKGNSPFRTGSDSDAFLLIVHDDGEHGMYLDYAANEKGSLYDLATHLEIPLPTRAQAAVSKTAYTDLGEYARRKGVPPAVFAAAGWREGQRFCPKHERERPALLFPTATGERARFIDGLKPPYMSPRGYEKCWYRLDEALALVAATGQPLIIANGEPSVIVAQHVGVAATAITGGGEQGIPGSLLDTLRARYTGPIWTAQDCDRTGRAAARTQYQHLVEAGVPDVRMLDLNGGTGFDLADFCRLHEAGAAAALPQLHDLPPEDCFPRQLTDKDTWPYFLGKTADEHGIWMHRFDKQGEMLPALRLCNFTASITAETVLDDGQTQDERYTITLTCGNRTRAIDMKRAEFEGEGAVRTITAALGARARVAPTTQPRTLLDAIKAFSSDVTERTIHTHTGWTEHRFLFGNGYVDRDGWHPDGGGQLPGRLTQYHLTPPNTSLPQAVTLFDTLLQLAPPSVIVPLVGAVLLAPIAEGLEAPAPMVHLYGTTGSYKTSASCVAMSLWGKFSPMQPTDSWTSTPFSIQRVGWHLKDVPMLLDDYKAANVDASKVTVLLQNYGDRMARGRLDANSELRAAYPIRATLISSGEDQPQGESSVFARILSVSVARNQVDIARLTTLQDQADVLPLLTIAYLRFLCREPPHAQNRATHRHLRSELIAQLATAQAANPGRVVSNVVSLYTAWASFVRFLEAERHWPIERTRPWLAICKRELVDLARAQLALTTQERYVETFLEVVRSLLASGRAVLHDLDADSQERLTAQAVIGAKDMNGIYLQSTVTFGEVSKHLRAIGQPVTFSKYVISQQLHQDGLLVSRKEPSLMVYKYVNGIGGWCWHLPHRILDGEEGA